MHTRIYLARHGETLWNKTQRLQGQLDSDLTPLGENQALAIAKKLADRHIDLIVSSPLGRAKKSALICQQILKVDHQIKMPLMERNLGIWQGEEIQHLKTLPDYHECLQQVTSLAIYNLESALNCGQRILESLKQLANDNSGKSVLVIFHGEALRCLLFLLGKEDTLNAFHLYKNGCIITVDFNTTTQEFTLVLDDISS
ncbi:histidine phosphatase family protein [Litorilituus lipolyticus]|nr:histidine phosphatase family protein [Litorilituus lipolyticus]